MLFCLFEASIVFPKPYKNVLVFQTNIFFKCKNLLFLKLLVNLSLSIYLNSLQERSNFPQKSLTIPIKILSNLFLSSSHDNSQTFFFLLSFHNLGSSPISIQVILKFLSLKNLPSRVTGKSINIFG